jgi:pyrroloquinoline quinone (PQQ) biosynthesis protein C
MPDMNSPTASFRQQLKRIQSEHPLFTTTHPFWRECFRGRLEKADIVSWALDVYPVIRDFSRLYIHVAAKCDDERILTFLSETIYEETGCGVEAESHPTLFRRFLASLDCPEEAISETPATAAGRKFFDHAWKTVREGDFIEGLTLVGLGIERPLPAFFKMLSRSLQRQFGLTEPDVRYYAIHTVADVKHSQLAARIVSELADTERKKEQVRTVLNRLWDLQRAQLDQLCERMGQPLVA